MTRHKYSVPDLRPDIVVDGRRSDEESVFTVRQDSELPSVSSTSYLDGTVAGPSVAWNQVNTAEFQVTSRDERESGVAIPTEVSKSLIEEIDEVPPSPLATTRAW